MTPSITADHGRHTPAARTAPKPAWKLATQVVGYGFGISVAYLAALIQIGYVVQWEGELANFFVWATPALPLLSLAVGGGLLALRAARPATRVAAAVACFLFGLFAFMVVRVAWTFTMTDWLTW
jgi:hypothetical protein